VAHVIADQMAGDAELHVTVEELVVLDVDLRDQRLEAIRERPAVVRAYEKAKAMNPNPSGVRAAEQRAILFGQNSKSLQSAVR